MSGLLVKASRLRITEKLREFIGLTAAKLTWVRDGALGKTMEGWKLGEGFTIVTAFTTNYSY